MMRHASVFLLLLLLVAPLRGQDQRTVTATEAEDAKEEANQFTKWNFGTGLGVLARVGGRTRISEARIVNKIVRVTRDNNVTGGFVLETHKYVMTHRSLVLQEESGGGRFRILSRGEARAARGVPKENEIPLIASGPFVGVRAGGDNIIQSIAVGWMIGMRRFKDDQSLGIGFGIAVDPQARVLGNGLEENKPLPEGETEIRYRDTAIASGLLMVSFNW